MLSPSICSRCDDCASVRVHWAVSYNSLKRHEFSVFARTVSEKSDRRGDIEIDDTILDTIVD